MALVYADHASTSFPTLFPPKESWGNPSNSHTVGRQAKAAMEEAHSLLHRTLRAPEGSSLLFTSGGTEANNMVLQGYPWDYIITARTEHAAVYLTAQYLANHRSVDVIYLTVDGPRPTCARTWGCEWWGPCAGRSWSPLCEAVSRPSTGWSA